MALSKEQQLEILLNRLKKVNYDLDEQEIFHLQALIRRGIVKIEVPQNFDEYLFREFGIEHYKDQQ